MKKQTRRSMLLTGLSLSTIGAALGLSKDSKVTPPTVKFLTEDGRLVEIDTDRLPKTSRVANANDIQQWIKK